MSEDKNIYEFIDKSLDYFYGKQLKLNKETKHSRDDLEILGIYDIDTKVWIWGWLSPYYSSDELIIVKELLNYGLSLEYRSNTDLHYYLKLNLVNSRIEMNDLELQIHLAIISYLLKDKSKFITVREFDNYKEYYIVK